MEKGLLYSHPSHNLCPHLTSCVKGESTAFDNCIDQDFFARDGKNIALKEIFLMLNFQLYLVPLCLYTTKKIIRISYGVIKCLIGINSKRIHGQSLFYLEGDGGGYDDGGGYNDDDADDDNGDGGGYIQLTIMIATCRSHRGFCAGFAV